MTALGSAFGSTAPVAALVFAVVAATVLFRLVRSPMLATAVLVAVVAGNLSGLVGYVGPLSVYLVALGIASVALGYQVTTQQAELRASPVLAFAVVWFVTRAVSALAAADPKVSEGVLLEDAKDILLLLVLMNLILLLGRPELVPAIACAVVAIFAALALFQEFVLGGAPLPGKVIHANVASEVAGLSARYSGPFADPNFWGRTLVLFIPLCLTLWTARVGGRSRAIWFVATALLFGGLYLTQSRGGQLALIGAVVCWFVLVIRDKVKLAAAMALLVVGIIIVPGTAHRLETLTSIEETPATAPADPSLQGRSDAQKASGAMFLDHPLLGVGPGNIEVVGRDYQRKLGLTGLAGGETPLAPHNIYLEMLAEGGIVGLAGWLTLFGGTIVIALRTRRRLMRSIPETSVEPTLLAGLAAGLVGWGVASLFLHLSDFPVLLICLALVAALEIRARDSLNRLKEQAPQALVPLRQRPSSSWADRPRAHLAALGLVLIFVSGYAAARAWAPGRWVTSFAVEVRPTATGSVAYVYDVLSRERTIPTMVSIALERRRLDAVLQRSGLPGPTSRDVRLSATRRPESAEFTFTVSCLQRDGCPEIGTLILDDTRQYLREQGYLYDIRPGDPTPPRRDSVDWPARAVSISLTGAGAVLLANSFRRRRFESDQLPPSPHEYGSVRAHAVP